MIFDQTLKTLRRSREIAGILFKYGFEELITNTPLAGLMPKRRRLSWKREKALVQYSRWEILRMMTEELGPTFIKLAQVLSNRPDIVPEPLLREFEKLQSNVPPFEFDVVRRIIEEESGQELHEVFKKVMPTPVGSASIGQVHIAWLRKNGKKVVVKVQRPGVRTKVATDLGILKEIVKRSDAFLKNQGILNAADIVAAFERSMQHELDYNTEARYIQQFRRYYAENKQFYVPRVYQDLSTSRMLVMEFVEGCKISDVAQLRAWGLSTAKIAETGMDIYLTQIFEHGYFHADPHPGNILIRPDGTICLIDFGMVGKLNRRDKVAFAGLLIGMAQKDVKKMASSFKRLAIDPNIEDERAFESDLSDLVDDFASLDVKDVNMADLALRLQRIIRDYHLQMPGGVFIILRALTLLEGIGKAIHPDFKTYEFFKPYAFRLFREQYSPGYMAEELWASANEFAGLFTRLPIELGNILHKVRKGNLRFEVVQSGYEPEMQRLSHALNRIAQAIVAAAIFLASALLLQSGAVGILYYVAIGGLALATLMALSVWVGGWWNR